MGAFCEVEIKKSLREEGHGLYGVDVSYRIQTSDDPSRIQIIDSYPEQLRLVEGEFVAEVATTTSWQTLSYKLALNVNPSRFSLANRTLDIQLAPAQAHFASKGEDRVVYSEGSSIRISLSELVIPKGGWVPL